MTRATIAGAVRTLRAVAAQASAEISGDGRPGDHIARGLSAEGYAGGYRDALHDVLAFMQHGHPGDQRGYWRRALAELRAAAAARRNAENEGKPD